MPITLWSHVSLRAARLLQSCCSQVSHEPPQGCWWESAASPRCVFAGDYRGDTFLCGPLAAGLPLRLTQRKATHLFLMCRSKYTAAMSAARLLHSFLLAQTMRKKCKNVEALFGLWPAEPRAACIVLFPELERATVDIFVCHAARAVRRRPRLQQGSRHRLV